MSAGAAPALPLFPTGLVETPVTNRLNRLTAFREQVRAMVAQYDGNVRPTYEDFAARLRNLLAHAEDGA